MKKNTGLNYLKGGWFIQGRLYSVSGLRSDAAMAAMAAMAKAQTSSYLPQLTLHGPLALDP